MPNIEEEYIRDKKYIHDTLEHTRKHMELLYGKLETFKEETSTAIAVIQTKLAFYVAASSIVTGIAVQYISHIIKGG